MLRLLGRKTNNKELAELLRQNGLIQDFGSYYDKRTDRACALGQIAYNLGYKTESSIVNTVRKFNTDETYKCTELCMMDHEFTFTRYVIHLNDDHRMSFEEIADVIDGLTPFEVTIEEGIFSRA